MKISAILLTMFLGFFINALSAQETIWLDTNWQPTSKDKAAFYRPVPQKKGNGYWIVDYYINGKVQMKGFSKTNTYNQEQFEGLVKYYYATGNRSHELNFYDGKLNGDRKEYFESGELKEVVNYENGKREGAYKAYYKNGKVKTRGKYRDGEKVGVWKTFYKNVYK